MKAVIVVCDDFVQFREYVFSHPSPSNQHYIPVFDEDTIRKILGFERIGIEIRIIGFRATLFFTGLRGGL